MVVRHGDRWLFQSRRFDAIYFDNAVPAGTAFGPFAPIWGAPINAPLATSRPSRVNDWCHFILRSSGLASLTMSIKPAQAAATGSSWVGSPTRLADTRQRYPGGGTGPIWFWPASRPGSSCFTRSAIRSRTPAGTAGSVKKFTTPSQDMLAIVWAADTAQVMGSSPLVNRWHALPSRPWICRICINDLK